MSDSSLPLTGIRVLDLSRLLPGPYATLLLADLGATVDKVEDPEGGDYLRHLPPHRGDESALFMALNRNKRSLALNLKDPLGAQALRRLCRHYDVLVESFRPGVLSKLGVGYEALQRENPRLVYCAISGYGQSGPDRLRAGHDLNYLARSGVLGYSGDAAEGPTMPGGQSADIGGSLFALVGILAALQERSRTGKGRLVDVSMTEGAMAFIHMQLGARLAMGEGGTPLARGRETLNGGLPCYGLYRTQDGRFLSVGSLEPKFFTGLCEALERPELVVAGYDAGPAGQAVRRELEAIFLTRPLAHWENLFRSKDLCVEPVREGDEVFEDPQLMERGMFMTSEDRHGGPLSYLRTPLHFGPVPLRPPPALGADSDAILTEAGFSPAERAALLGSPS